MIFFWLGLALTPALALGSPELEPGVVETSRAAMEVLMRTKRTKATYSLYLWNRMTDAGKSTREEWSAEFHSGDLHRVETPRDRLVANCRMGTGFAFSAVTGRSYEGAWIAATACGIDSNTPLDSLAWEGTVKTSFGPADRVRVVAGDLVRSYDVSPDGILLATVYSDRGSGEAVRLVNWATGVEKKLPEKDIFSRASLKRSVVPERFKQAPARKS